MGRRESPVPSHELASVLKEAVMADTMFLSRDPKLRNKRLRGPKKSATVEVSEGGRTYTLAERVRLRAAMAWVMEWWRKA
jgi:hypothetical protein